MFSALTQGSSVYLLDKTSAPIFEIGEVVGVTQPYGFGQTTVNLKVKVDGNIQEFSNLPSINSITSYNNGKVIISETKLGIQNEVEALLQSSRQVLDNIDTYKQNIVDCESILKKLNPQFAKDKERDDRLMNLENKFTGVENKLEEIFNYIKK